VNHRDDGVNALFYKGGNVKWVPRGSVVAEIPNSDDVVFTGVGAIINP